MIYPWQSPPEPEPSQCSTTQYTSPKTYTEYLTLTVLQKCSLNWYPKYGACRNQYTDPLYDRWILKLYFSSQWTYLWYHADHALDHENCMILDLIWSCMIMDLIMKLHDSGLDHESAWFWTWSWNCMILDLIMKMHDSGLDHETSWF